MEQRPKPEEEDQEQEVETGRPRTTPEINPEGGEEEDTQEEG